VGRTDSTVQSRVYHSAASFCFLRASSKRARAESVAASNPPAHLPPAPFDSLATLVVLPSTQTMDSPVRETEPMALDEPPRSRSRSRTPYSHHSRSPSPMGRRRSDDRDGHVRSPKYRSRSYSRGRTASRTPSRSRTRSRSDSRGRSYSRDGTHSRSRTRSESPLEKSSTKASMPISSKYPACSSCNNSVD
jgi:hypothetical protein